MAPENYRDRPRKERKIQHKVIYEDKSVRAPLKEAEFVAVTSDDDPQGKEGDLIQLSPTHGRSVEDKRVKDVLLFEDKNHVLFGTRGYKGGEMEGIELEEDEYSPYGIKTIGLKDNVGLDNIARASETLREHDLPTEVVTKKAQLEEVLIDGQPVPIDEWKRKVITDIQREIDECSPEDNLKREQLVAWKAQVSEYLEKTDFYLVERNLQVAERVADILHARDIGEVRAILGKVFRWLKQANTVSRSSGERWQYNFDRDLDPENDEDIIYFVSQWLPRQMGRYLSELHSLGCIHGFASYHNWSLAGTLYDLDSLEWASGEELEAGRSHDLFANSSSALWHLLCSKTLGYKRVDNPIPDLLKAHDLTPHQVFQEALVEMLSEYLGNDLERYTPENEEAVVDKVLAESDYVDFDTLQEIAGGMEEEEIEEAAQQGVVDRIAADLRELIRKGTKSGYPTSFSKRMVVSEVASRIKESPVVDSITGRLLDRLDL